MRCSRKETMAIGLLVRWASNSEGEVKRIGYPKKPVWNHLIPDTGAAPARDEYDICESIVLRGSEEDIAIITHHFGFMYHKTKRKNKLPGVVSKYMKANTPFSPTSARIKAKADTVISIVAEEVYRTITKQSDSRRRSIGDDNLMQKSGTI